MRFTARIFSRFLIFILVFTILLPSFSVLAYAQIPSPTNEKQESQNITQYIKPDVESGVPLNQHTFIQAMFIEMLLAVQCQLTGIDLASPTGACLGINLATGKFSYGPQTLSQNGFPPIGGVLGMLNSSIGYMFTPVASSKDYVHYLANSFGITKTTYAAPATGFEGLSPVLGLWRGTRDIAYFLLTIAFIFIGIGVMLRIHIDPRTVMTVQNQIPRVIICIILITFSYAFAGLLIDTMWTVTYMGVNKITQLGVGADPNVLDCAGAISKLSTEATTKILDSPFAFAHKIFMEPGCVTKSGILDLGTTVGKSIGIIQQELFLQLFGAQNGCTFDLKGAGIGGLIGSIIFPGAGTLVGGLLGGAQNLGTCITAWAINYTLGWAFQLMWIIIVVIILIITLFRIWFELLKAYAISVIYVILGPIWIVFGLLPKKPLGFEKWLRIYFANLAVFPATVFIIVGARVLGELFNKNPQNTYVPPLVGNPATGHLGVIIEFAMLLMAPTLLSIIREKLSVVPLKQFGAAMQTFQAGRAIPGGLAKRTFAGLTRRNPTTGRAEGVLARIGEGIRVGTKKKLFGVDAPFGYRGKGRLRKLFSEDAERDDMRRKTGHYMTYDEYYNDPNRVDPRNPNSPNNPTNPAYKDAQKNIVAPTLTRMTTLGTRIDPREIDLLLTHQGKFTPDQEEIVVRYILDRGIFERSGTEAKFLEKKVRDRSLTYAQLDQYQKQQERLIRGVITVNVPNASGGREDRMLTPQPNEDSATLLARIIPTDPNVAAQWRSAHPNLSKVPIGQISDTDFNELKRVIEQQANLGRLKP